MSVQVTIDGRPVSVPEGTSLIEAAAAQGIYVPTLCYVPGRDCLGTCRVCLVRVDGHIAAGCSVAVREGAVVEVDTAELNGMRRELVELQFVDGTHNCPSCEKSGRCQLQAVAYEVGMQVAEYPYRHPQRAAEHAPARIWLERDRCILCHRCVQLVHDRTTGANIFALRGRGDRARIEVDTALADAMPEDQIDEAVELCPVGAILRKGVGYDEPIGHRRYERVTLSERTLARQQGSGQPGKETDDDD